MICIIGLGYVGLPLACALSKHFKVGGYDVSQKKMDLLKNGEDYTGEVNKEDLKNIVLIDDLAFHRNDVNTYIICVPTPINQQKQPDLTALKSASQLVANNLKNGDLVIFESTVYPGCIEEVCLPILKNQYEPIDFSYGYSPERINPGDKIHTICNTTKVVSGQNPEVAKRVANIYNKITTVHIAQSIKVAEAAKVIENVQRDVNIALMNEFTMLFHELGINSGAVFEAAKTKWNFLDFRPGLVGGHCIPVDPYYLASKAQEMDFHPELILAGRRVNESIPKFVASEIAKRKVQNVLILGMTFKPNVGDVRNSLSKKLKKELSKYDLLVEDHDPFLHGTPINKEICYIFDALVLAVAHDEYKDLNLRKLIHPDGLIFDLTGTLQDCDWSL